MGHELAERLFEHASAAIAFDNHNAGGLTSALFRDESAGFCFRLVGFWEILPSYEFFLPYLNLVIRVLLARPLLRASLNPCRLAHGYRAASSLNFGIVIFGATARTLRTLASSFSARYDCALR